MFSKFFVWQELIWLHHFVSYEYFRIMIWHGLNFEHFKKLENLEDLENLKSLDNWVFWTFWELTCSFRSILSSDSILLSLVFFLYWKCMISGNYFNKYPALWNKLTSRLHRNLDYLRHSTLESQSLLTEWKVVD